MVAPAIKVLMASGGGGAIGDPTDIADCIRWYDASDTGSITTSGSDVTQWNDKSGGGYHLTQYSSLARPQSGTRTLNSLNVVDFANQTIANANGFNPLGGGTVFIVCKRDASHIGSLFNCNTPSNADDYWRVVEVSGPVYMSLRDDGTTDDFQINSTTSTATERVITGRVGGGNVDIAIDDTVEDSDTYGSISGYAVSYLMLGSMVQTNSLFQSYDGVIGEVILYARSLSNAECTQVVDYLSAKWGTA